ncbi:MAG TPA: helix-turn-helix domain-containing protein [Gaiellaceae bacterium]
MFEIGNSLREARMRQGLDYPQVELATKIRAKYIRALEEEEFEILPSGTYIKGFMRSYADFLGLDGQLYVDEYNSRHVSDGFLDEQPPHRPRARRDRSVDQRVVFIVLALIAVVTALVIAAWKFGGSDAGAPKVLTPPHKTVPKGLQFIGVKQGTYLEIRRHSSTGPVLFQGPLRPGDAEFLVGKQFWMLVRRPAGVHFKLLGKPVSLPARHNLRVRVTPTKTVRTPA